MPEGLEQALVGAVVGLAALYLVDKYSGVSARLRARKKPDVPVGRLVRKPPKRE